MNNEQKLLLPVSVLAILLFMGIVWLKMPHDEQGKQEVKTEHITAVEKGLYDSAEDAQKAMVKNIVKTDDVVSAIYTPNKAWKTQFYVIQVSYHKNKSTYSGFAFAVPEGNQYRLVLGDVDIKTYDGMQPKKDTMKVGKDTVQMYVGNPVSNPFEDSIRHSFVEDQVEVAYQVQ